jgi:hypothetical protein
MSKIAYRKSRAPAMSVAVTLIALLLGTPATAQYGVPQSVAGSGGAEIVGTNFGVRSTAGQPIIGRTEHAGYVQLAGYWYNPGTTVTGVSDGGNALPTVQELFQNFPNPFNPTTTIRFALPAPSHVTLTVYNVGGQRVKTLVDRRLERGFHNEVFDASGLASGVYFYRLETGAFVQTRKMVILK